MTRSYLIWYPINLPLLLTMTLHLHHGKFLQMGFPSSGHPLITWRDLVLYQLVFCFRLNLSLMIHTRVYPWFRSQYRGTNLSLSYTQSVAILLDTRGLFVPLSCTIMHLNVFNSLLTHILILLSVDSWVLFLPFI